MNWTVNLLGWREIILTLILLIVLYMVWLIWRMRRLGQTRTPVSTSPPRAEPGLSSSPSSSSSADPPASTVAMRRERERERDREEEEDALIYSRRGLHVDSTKSANSANSADPVRRPPSLFDESGLAEQTFMSGVAREMEESREEIESLRGALAALREEMDQLRAAFAQEVQSAHIAQNASPLYSEAMQMAVLGHDALTIAERCGISRAEAELVVSLMKNKEGKAS